MSTEKKAIKQKKLQKNWTVSRRKIQAENSKILMRKLCQGIKMSENDSPAGTSMNFKLLCEAC
jgi:hypothetical protein